MAKGRFGQALLTGAIIAAAFYNPAIIATGTAGGGVGFSVLWKTGLAKAIAFGAGAAILTYAFYRNQAPDTPRFGENTTGVKLGSDIRPRFRRYGHGLVDGHCVWLETFDELNEVSVTRRVRERIPGSGGGDDDPQYRTVTRTFTASAKTTCFAYLFNVSYGQCDAVTGMYIQGKRVPLVRDTTNTNVLTASPTSRYHRILRNAQGEFPELRGPLVEVHEFFSAQGEAAASTEISRINQLVVEKNASGATTWGSTDLCMGYSQILVIVRQPKYGDTRADQEPDDDKLSGRFWRTVPPTGSILFELRGNKLTWPGQTTPVWTDNPAIIYRDLIINELGEPTSRIHATEFDAARRVCERTVNISGLQGWRTPMPATIKRYAAFLDYASGESIRGVFDSLDKAMSGNVVDADGLYHFRPGTERTARVTIDESVIVEGGLPEIQPAPSQNERLNVAKMTLKQNALDGFKAYVVPDVRDEAAIVRDGREYPYNFGELRCVTNASQAALLGTTALREGRNAKTMTLTVLPGANWEYWSLIPTDPVTVNLPRENISNEKWEVFSRRRNSKNFTVTLTLKKWAPGRYTPNLVLPELPTVVPDADEFVPTPTGLTAVPRVSFLAGSPSPQWALDVSWNPVPANTVVYIEQAGGREPQRSGILSGDRYTFVGLDTGIYNVIVNHIGQEGEISDRAVIIASIEPQIVVSQFPVEAPVFVGQQRLRSVLQLNFAPPTTLGLSGIDIRYTFSSSPTVQNLPELTEENWVIASRRLVTTNVVPTPGFATQVQAQIAQTGTYRMFARHRNSIGGLSPIVEVGTIRFSVPLIGTTSLNLWPAFLGELTNMFVWEHGSENWLIPDSPNARETTLAQWNLWPWGDAPSGEYVMPAIDLGESRQVTVQLSPIWVGNGAELTTPLPQEYTAPNFALQRRAALTDAWTVLTEQPFVHTSNRRGEYEALQSTTDAVQVRVIMRMINATGSNIGLRRFDISVQF